MRRVHRDTPLGGRVISSKVCPVSDCSLGISTLVMSHLVGARDE